MSVENLVKLLESRGVQIDQVAEIVHKLQHPYNASLTMEECRQSVLDVLKKRDVQYALYTGIALDQLAEQKALPQPLQAIMEEDESLYGVDETIALAIVSVYGMIGLTSFGYLDKEKTGVIREINECKTGIHVFLDDLICGLAAAASAKIAHQNPNVRKYPTE